MKLPLTLNSTAQMSKVTMFSLMTSAENWMILIIL